MNEVTKKNDGSKNPGPKPVRLADVLGEMEFQPEGWVAYVNVPLGEVVSAPEDLDEAEMMSGVNEELTELVEAIESSDDFVPLPSKFDIHEWSVMRDFSAQVEDEDCRRELFNAIHGSGAFRFFKREVDRLGLRDSWFRYRDEAIERIAIEFLEAHEIPWTRG